jgi:hypothetical protein
LFPRNKRGEGRVSPSAYRLLLAARVVVSGGWLGIALAQASSRAPRHDGGRPRRLRLPILVFE